ncbi:hypothetical protein [Clostridium amazonitimonense]|uniref:hypothetical protein n=1 Tax=Clostridium amazonitimonense TaxID=1499689 RepID=UPI000509F1C0|nr:hypothetical protein [Clostridium amazonitimonense]
MKKLIWIVLIGLLNFVFLMGYKSYNDEDLINKFVVSLEGKPEEYGMKIEFQNVEEDRISEIYEDIDKILIKYEKINKDADVEENKDIKFINKKEEGIELKALVNKSEKVGYIEVKLNIESIMEKEKIEKEVLRNVERERSAKVYKYVKAKVEDDSLEECKTHIEELLVSEKNLNIDIKFTDFGVIGTALTNKASKNGNSPGCVDINFAVMRYTSGTYLIVGTPIIYNAY